MDQLFKFLPYQVEYIRDNSKILVVEKPRQVGITYTSGYKVVTKILRSNKKDKHYWLSRDENTAKEFVTNVMDWLHLFNVVAQREVVDMKDVRTTKVTFPNGTELFILSSSVDAVVGKSGHFYLDEFAIHKDQELLMAIVLPCITWQGSLTIISTHRSKQTYFYKLCEKVRKGQMVGARLISFTIMDAIEQGIVEMINNRSMLQGEPTVSREEWLAEKKANAPSEDVFQQEYMCIPADSDSSMAIHEDVIDRNSLPKEEILQPRKDGGKYYAGVDIGRHRDLTVIWILEDVSKSKEPMLVTRFVKTIKREEFSVQEKKIFDVLNRWKPRMTFVDGTNTGAMIGENIQKRYGIKRAQSIKITAVTRPKFIGDLVNVMSKDFLHIPDDKEVWDDFMSVSRYIGKHGNIDYWIPSRADEGHGDRFMACTLAVQAFIEKGGMSSYYLRQAKVVRDLDAEEEERQEETRTINRKIRAKKHRRFNY